MKQIPHGYKNQEGRFWNDKTKKFVVRLQESKVGKAKGKTKGNTYQKQLELIQKEEDYKPAIAWLPINLSIKQILMDVKAHWDFETHAFELDRFLSLMTLMIVKRNKNVSLDYYHKEGYVRLHSDDLKKWIHLEHYHKYIQFAITCRYIACLDYYVPNRYPKKYRFFGDLIKKEGDHRKYYKIEYTTPRLQVRLYKQKQEAIEQQLKIETRRELTTNLYKILGNYDLDGFTSWAITNVGAFVNKDDKTGVDTMNRNICNITQLHALENIYINPKDDYGFRYHHPFTNSKRESRKFIRIGGEYAQEVDIKNSQFFLLALLTLHGKKCFRFLFKELTTQQRSDLRRNIHTLENFYANYSDYKEFIDESLKGNIYQHTISRLKNKYTKAQIKDRFFKAFFSQEGECKQSKQLLRKIYPNLIRVCEIINATASPLPFALQRLESFLYLDLISTKAHNLSNYEFLTVHDSFICSPADASLFQHLIETTFSLLELPTPKTNKSYGKDIN
jgi:hypothetical protein